MSDGVPPGSGSRHITARCSEEQKARYLDLAKRFGYDTFSDFLIHLLDAACERYEVEGWECRILHLVEDRIVGSGPQATVEIRTGSSAFPIVGSEGFWAHVDALDVGSGPL